MAPPIGHNMSQTGDGNSMGGESGRGGNVGHTGTGCYKNHEHSMLHGPQPPAAAAAAANRHHRRPSVAAAAGAVSIAAVTALLTSSPATNAAGHQPTQPSNNLVDLGKSLIHARKKKEEKIITDDCIAALYISSHQVIYVTELYLSDCRLYSFFSLLKSAQFIIPWRVC